MEWHKVEDYPAESDEYVLVSSEMAELKQDDNIYNASMTYKEVII